MKKWIANCLFITMAIFIGCSGGDARLSESSSREVSFRLSVLWPNGDADRHIPNQSEKIAVSIYSNDLYTELGYAEINYGESSVLIEKNPSGSCVAEIAALNSAGGITAQRRESFIL